MRLRLLMLALLLALPTPSWAAIAFVNNVAAGSADGNNVTTVAVNNTGANFLICDVAFSYLIAITVSDSSSNTWTPLTQRNPAVAGAANRLYYVENATVSAAQTFTVTSTAAVPSIACASFSGVRTPSSFDVENGASSAGSTSLQPGSVTPSLNDSLLITGISFNGAVTTVAVNSSFTITDTVAFVAAQHYGVSLSYLLLGTAAATNPTWSWTTSTANAASIAVFKNQPAAGASIVPPSIIWMLEEPER